MKTLLLFSFVIIILFQSPNCFSQTTIPGGFVYGNWPLSGSPYNVTGSIQIPNDSTLTIEPGVTVNFQGAYKFVVRGRLLAVGNAVDTITFTAANTTNGWKGLRFDNTTNNNDTSRFAFCKIQYGKATGTIPDSYGGAFYFDNFSKAVISNCRIRNCHSYTGGGAFVFLSSDVKVMNSDISNNSYQGDNTCGFCYSAGCVIYADKSRFSLSNCTLIDNYTTGTNLGSAMLVLYSCAPSITNCTISSTSLSPGQGIYTTASGYINGTIYGATYNNNSISMFQKGAMEVSAANGKNSICGNTFFSNGPNNTGQPAGLFVGVNANSGPYNILVDNNEIYNNIGGGLFFNVSGACDSITVTNNFISNNSYNDVSSTGGAAFYCAGVNSKLLVANNILSNNQALSAPGGAMSFLYCSDSSPRIYNNTIVNNKADKGGAIFIKANGSSITPEFKNNIIWGNEGITSPSQIFLEDELADPNFYYNNIEGGSGSIDANGNFYLGTYSNNINSNPNFVSSSGGSGTGFNGLTADWSLQSGSTSIDTGDPSSVFPTTDFAGNPRVTVCRVDQGAYEYQNGIPFSVSLSQTSPILCNGGTTGELEATATGGGAPYTYTWTPGGSNGSTLSNIGQGTYTVTASNSNGCTRTKVITITEPIGMTLTPSQTNINCNGTCDGSASVTVSGGTGSYSYSWSTLPIQTTSGTTPTLCTGPYTVTVTDGSGCTAEQTYTITSPTALSFTTNETNVSCYNGNNGSITVNATGGSGTLQYSNTGGISYQLSNVFMGLTQGTYDIVTKDNLGCQTNVTTVIISEPTQLTSTLTQTDIRCYSANNATATVLPTGGTAPYLYSWSPNGGTDQTAINLSASNYTCAVTDNLGCTISVPITITSNLALAAICLVTTDSLSINNHIYWDKSNYNLTQIDSFIVYREVSSGIYSPIGAVSKDSVGLFIDTTRSVGPANGDPNIGYYHYKLQIRDSCGSYGPLSPFHTSVYFIDQNNGTFNWNLYEVEGQSTPVANFELMRDDANTNNYLTIGTVSGTTNILNDPSYLTYQGIANWRVEATGFNCLSTLRQGENNVNTVVVKSKSNIKNNRVIGLKELNNHFTIHPNPVDNELSVTLSKNHLNCQIQISNILGQVQKIVDITGFENKILLTELPNGVYFVKLIGNSNSTAQKLVIQH